jgi:hypothetical protein
MVTGSDLVQRMVGGAIRRQVRTAKCGGKMEFGHALQEAAAFVLCNAQICEL